MILLLVFSAYFIQEIYQTAQNKSIYTSDCFIISPINYAELINMAIVRKSKNSNSYV